MTWNEVREMYTAGMEFGSHSMTHPTYEGGGGG